MFINIRPTTTQPNQVPLMACSSSCLVRYANEFGKVSFFFLQIPRETDPKNLLRGMDKIMADSLLQLHIWDIVEPFRPYIDGYEITDQPLTLFREGKWQTNKPIIIGTNEEELDVFKYFDPFDFAVGPGLYRVS